MSLVEMVNKYIVLCDKVIELDNAQEAKCLQEKLLAVFAGRIGNLDYGLEPGINAADAFDSGCNGVPCYENFDVYLPNIAKLRGKLELY